VAAPKTPILPNEGVARAVAAAAPKGERAEVWKEAVETAPKDATGKPKVTAKHVQKVSARRAGKPSREDKSDRPKDYAGHEIRDRIIADAFAAREQFTNLMTEVSFLKGKFDNLARRNGGQFAARHVQEWEARVSNLHGILRFSRPHSICPYCGGDPNRSSFCEPCKRQGWMPEEIYKAVPAEIRGGGDQ
jgi:hypothetical protein